jgi:hypothetical protein
MQKKRYKAITSLQARKLEGSRFGVYRAFWRYSSLRRSGWILGLQAAPGNDPAFATGTSSWGMITALNRTAGSKHRAGQFGGAACLESVPVTLALYSEYS